MTATRNKTRSPSTNSEECKSKVKYARLLKVLIITKYNNLGNITKRKTPTIVKHLPSLSTVKLEEEEEEETDSKTLLESSPTKRDRKLLQEKLNRFFDLVLNNKISLTKACKKVDLHCKTGYKYYNIYQADPEHKIPQLLETTNRDSKKKFVGQARVAPKFYTDDQIKKLIEYVEVDKMTVSAASRKAGMGLRSGSKYYLMYKHDPDRTIPKAGTTNMRRTKPFSYEEIKALIHHIVDDKMSVSHASRILKVSEQTAARYYDMYLVDPERNIPQPVANRIKTKTFTTEQVGALIKYLTVDKMSISRACAKAHMSKNSAQKYYLQYMNDPNRQIPVPKDPRTFSCKRISQEKIKEVVDYIVKDNCSTQLTAIKADVSVRMVKKYYKIYLEHAARGEPYPVINDPKP